MTTVCKFGYESNIYPEFADVVKTGYGELLENSESSNNQYVKDYMTVIKPYLSDVASKNEKIFKTTSTYAKLISKYVKISKQYVNA